MRNTCGKRRMPGSSPSQARLERAVPRRRARRSACTFGCDSNTNLLISVHWTERRKKRRRRSSRAARTRAAAMWIAQIRRAARSRASRSRRSAFSNTSLHRYSITPQGAMTELEVQFIGSTEQLHPAGQRSTAESSPAPSSGPRCEDVRPIFVRGFQPDRANNCGPTPKRSLSFSDPFVGLIGACVTRVAGFGGCRRCLRSPGFSASPLSAQVGSRCARASKIRGL